MLIPDSRDPDSPRLDVPGIGALDRRAVGNGVGADRGARARLDQLDILAAFALGAAIMAAFVAWERRTAQPMLDVRVFRNLRFSAASVSVMFVFFALMGVMYFLTTYLQSVLGYTALEAGVRLAADRGWPDRGLAAVGAGSRARFGSKVVVGGGLLLVAGSSLGGFTAGRGSTPRTSTRSCGSLTAPGPWHGVRDGAGDRGDHGLAAEGEGRDRLGDERRGPRGRRHARRGRAREHREHELRGEHGGPDGGPAGRGGRGRRRQRRRRPRGRRRSSAGAAAASS